MNGLDPVPGPREVARQYLALELALSRARAVQWDPAPHGGSGGGARRAAGGYANPTLSTVMDTRREKVSDAVRGTEQQLRVMSGLISALIAHLDAAVAEWEGETPR